MIGKRKTKSFLDISSQQKIESFLAYFMRIPDSCVVWQVSILQTGVAPANPAAHLACSTARIRRDITAASFCSYRLLWHSDEFVLLACFNARSDIFAVMNGCVVALSVFSSDVLAWSAECLYSVRRHIK